MLETLHNALEQLPSLLAKAEDWNDVLVDYHPPIVERVWLQFGENRIYLHCIHPCSPEESLFHPHPWPSAMRVCSGRYEMGLGYYRPPKLTINRPSKGERTTYGEANVVLSTLVLNEGSEYEMVDPSAWHYVRPLGTTAYSIMVTGKPFPTEARDKNFTAKPQQPLKRLGPIRKAEMLWWFRDWKGKTR
jgi:hypothetical protein